MTISPTFYSEAVARAEALGSAWRESAACQGQDPALFFPEPGQGGKFDFEPALRLCRECPVSAQCRAWALEAKEINRKGYAVHGVIGGVAPKDRSQQTKLRSFPDLQPCGTYAAYQRHRRAGEPVCGPCREAAAATHRRQRRERAS